MRFKNIFSNKIWAYGFEYPNPAWFSQKMNNPTESKLAHQSSKPSNKE